MAKGGAPTSMWPAVPGHLGGRDEPGDPKAAEARLIVRRPDVPVVEIPLERAEFTIGRSSEVDLTLDDELVSRRHAVLTMDARGYFKLADLGSRNGIQYAGRVVRRLNLIDGDVFAIGKTELEFHAKMSRFEKPSTPPARADSVYSEVFVPDPEPTIEPDVPLTGGAASRGLPPEE